MAKDSNISIRVDTNLKTQAEEVLSEFGLTLAGTFNMLLKQIVREHAVPLTLSMSSTYSLYADLLEAQTERAEGYVGRSGAEVAKNMKDIIDRIEAEKSNG